MLATNMNDSEVRDHQLSTCSAAFLAALQLLAGLQGLCSNHIPLCLGRGPRPLLRHATGTSVLRKGAVTTGFDSPASCLISILNEDLLDGISAKQAHQHSTPENNFAKMHACRATSCKFP